MRGIKRFAAGFVCAALALVAPPPAPASAAPAGGPITLMGIDAEDGGVGGHGPISVYVSVVSSVLANVTNGGSGILVAGGGKAPGDHVTTWWNGISAGTGQPVTYVNGAAGISAQSFAGFKLVGVASSVNETPSGGLTEAENTALAGRSQALADHVNGGGGLVGFSQARLANPYGYLGTVGEFVVNVGLQNSLITPTPEGSAVGITDALDLCCWHDEYLRFPDFLKVLATYDDAASRGNAAAIGGQRVIIYRACTPAELTVSITRPAPGRTYEDDVDEGPSGAGIVVKGSPLTVQATTSDPSKTLQVEFFLDGVLRGTDAAVPYSAVLDTATLSLGSHTIRVRATHNDLPCRTTTDTTFDVRCFDVGLSIDRPASGRAYRNDVDVGPSGAPEAMAIGGPLTVRATSANLARTTLVEFRVDAGPPVPDLTGNPFETVVQTDLLSPGRHTISARLVERNPACSTLRTVTLLRPQPSVKAVATGLYAATNVPVEPVVLAGGARVQGQGGSDSVRILGREVPPAIDHVHVITDNASGDTAAAFGSRGDSLVADVSLLGGLVTADVLHAKTRASYDYATATASAADDGSEVLNLRVAGMPVPVVAPNTVVPLPGGMGQVVVQETLPVTDGQRAEITVNMIHVYADTGVFAGEVVVGSAHAGVNLADFFTGPEADLIHRPDDADTRADAGDTEATATPLGPGLYSGSFTPSDPTDFYAIDTLQGERVLAVAKPAERAVVRVNPLPAPPDRTLVTPGLSLILRDPDGEVRASSDLAPGLAPSAPERVEINADKPYDPPGTRGTWTLEVRRSEGSPDAFYTLELSLLPAPLRSQEDAGIPGDAPDVCASARPLPAGQEIDNRTFAGVIRDADTADFYSFDVSIGQLVSAVVKPDELDDGADLDVYLYGPSSPGAPADCTAPIQSSTFGKEIAKALPEAVYTLPATISGTYVLEIRRYNAVANYYVNLNVSNPLLTLSGNDAGSGADAGDDCSTASALEPGAYQGRLADVPDDDREDWYRVALGAGQDITAAMKPSEASNFDLELYTPGCAPVPPDRLTVNHLALSAPETVHVADSGGGEYRIRVVRVSGGGNYMLGAITSP